MWVVGMVLFLGESLDGLIAENLRLARPAATAAALASVQPGKGSELPRGEAMARVKTHKAADEGVDDLHAIHTGAIGAYRRVSALGARFISG